MLALFAGPASAQSFSQLFGFGDSTIDSGWWKGGLAVPPQCDSVAVPCDTGGALRNTLTRNALAQGGTGAPVGVGLMNSQILASDFGLTAFPANQAGGTNYAIPGSVDNRSALNGFIGNLGPNLNLPSTVQQIANYLAANGGHANPNGLYLISSGSNDIAFAAAILPPGAQEPYLASQAAALSSSVATLQTLGARYIVVPNVYDSGTLIDFYNQTLWSNLHTRGVQFIPADVQTMRAAVQANPTAFGFTAATVMPGVVGPTTGSACVTPIGAPPTTSAWGSNCANTTTPSPSYAYLRSANSEQTSFFSDDLHFSAAGQKIEADYIYSLIVAPSEISLLAENAVQMRFGLVTGIQEQLDIALQRPGSGFNIWANGDVSSLKVKNENPGFPGETASTPISGTVGLNFVSPEGLLLGGAISAGSKKPGFDLGGHFTQDEAAVSMYAGYRLASFWVDAIATFGILHYDVNRVVPVGISLQPNSGTTQGQDLSLAAQGGYNFRNGWILHGPVVGVILQRVNVDGFAESGSFTSLSFEDQVRDSAVSALGYRAYVDVGIIQPFAQIGWYHEWASTDRLVAASLTTTTAPSYSLPAVQLGKDWGTGTVGAKLKLGNDWTGLASFTTQVGQHGVTNYGGLVGLNYAFGWSNPVVAKY